MNLVRMNDVAIRQNEEVTLIIIFCFDQPRYKVLDPTWINEQLFRLDDPPLHGPKSGIALNRHCRYLHFTLSGIGILATANIIQDV